MEERKKKLENDLKNEAEKTSVIKVELAKAEAKAEYAEKAKTDFMKRAAKEGEGDQTDAKHELEVKIGRLEGQISGMKQPCDSRGCCDSDCKSPTGAPTSEDAIQTAVDSAVEKLINKTRERKTEGNYFRHSHLF